MSMYFENDENLKSNKQKLTIKYKNISLDFYTDNGVFSKNKFDYGSRLLLENLEINNLCGKLLDLGCGYGPIGIYLAKTTTCDIDMIDINERAIELCRENIKLNNIKNATCYISNVYDSVDKKYNYIITNPPIRAGKEILRKILIGAKDYLEELGQLWFVMRKDHGVKTMIKELESHYNIEIIDKSKGFYIVKCIKK